MKTPIFGEPVPEMPFFEEPNPTPCPVCGYTPHGMSFYGVTVISCLRCHVKTDEYTVSADAWQAWEARAVHP